MEVTVVTVVTVAGTINVLQTENNRAENNRARIGRKAINTEEGQSC